MHFQTSSIVGLRVSEYGVINDDHKRTKEAPGGKYQPALFVEIRFRLREAPTSQDDTKPKTKRIDTSMVSISENVSDSAIKPSAETSVVEPESDARMQEEGADDEQEGGELEVGEVEEGEMEGGELEAGEGVEDEAVEGKVVGTATFPLPKLFQEEPERIAGIKLSFRRPNRFQWACVLTFLAGRQWTHHRPMGEIRRQEKLSLTQYLRDGGKIGAVSLTPFSLEKYPGYQEYAVKVKP